MDTGKANNVYILHLFCRQHSNVYIQVTVSIFYVLFIPNIIIAVKLLYIKQLQSIKIVELCYCNVDIWYLCN